MMLVAKLGLQLALMPFRGLAASYRPANFKHLELRVLGFSDTFAVIGVVLILAAIAIFLTRKVNAAAAGGAH